MIPIYTSTNTNDICSNILYTYVSNTRQAEGMYKREKYYAQTPVHQQQKRLVDT